MATIRLTPSTYYLSSTSYLSISNAANMYNNTDNSTYATITNSRASTTSYYIYLRGFNFSDIPSGAIINSFTIKLKARESGVSTSTSYKPYLANGTTTINGSCDVITTTAATHTFTGISADWDTIVDYGSTFGIRINCRRASRNTTSYMYIYGAEILVDYTIPVHHNITINNSTSTTVTATDSNPLEGSDVEIRSSTISGITVTDNGTDVTNQFEYKTDSGRYEVENVGSYGFSLNGSGYYQSDNKGIDKSAAVCRVNLSLPTSATVTFTFINYAEEGYDFGVFGNIDTSLNHNYYPANGGISDTSYKLACNSSSHNKSTEQTLTYSVSSGEHFIDVKYSKDDASASGNDTLQFKVSITLDGSAPSYYGYTITNVQGDHLIVVSESGGDTNVLFVKQNGSWVQVQTAYVKQNGTWSSVDISSVFSSDVNYVNGGSV